MNDIDKKHIERNLETKIAKHRSALVLAAGLLLVIMTVAAYLPAMRAGYIWDDETYVIMNPLLKKTSGLLQSWIPKQLPSQYFPMVYTTFWFEHQVWGLNPFGYHLTNVILHAINSLLLWWLLFRLKIRGAWFISAIFALHPVHVESVAWITERKNVLSLLFYLGSALAYTRYAFGPKGADAKKTDKNFYLLSTILFFFALASKAVTCTLPVALLIVCWWKRGRIRWADVRDLTIFFALGIAWGLLIMWWEHTGQGTGRLDLGLTSVKRLLIASRALWFYIWKLIWPTKLTFSYPKWDINAADPFDYSWLLLCSAVVWCLWYWRDKLGRGPIAAASFFAVTLGPMLGFFSLFTFFYTYVADHYQYVASIGPITLFVTACLRSAARFGKWTKGLAMVIAATILVTLGTLTWKQCHIYKDQETLWRDTLAKNPNAVLAHNNLGCILLMEDKVDEAAKCFRQALHIRPDYPDAYGNLGNILMQQGKLDEAADCFRKALHISPDFAVAHGNLGSILLMQGKIGEASNHLRQSLQFKPNDAQIHFNFGIALGQQGKYDDAVKHLKEALRLKPDWFEAHYFLGLAYTSQGNFEQAIQNYKDALRLEPDSVDPMNRLAWLLAAVDDVKLRDPAEAVRLAERACELTKYEQPELLDTLAVAYAAAGRYIEAIEIAEKAFGLAKEAGRKELSEEIQDRLQLYKAGRPYRQLSPAQDKVVR